ncbi:MAG: fumarylacetoacetate hydrolase family protein [Caldilineales bacterium]|nr:fumarylacetoacetate hydrolase family protein [Caldilineales bacterium]
MVMEILIRYHHPDFGIRLGLQRGGEITDISPQVSSLGDWLRASAGRVPAAIDELRKAADQAPFILPASELDQPPSSRVSHWLPPVDRQDVWAAGVTYERSRQARQEEAIDGGDVYARVYAAERPELFFKARAPWVQGPLGPVGIRGDARWSVPEPELALVINPALEIVGWTAGNDMSSRDIEGENPLYLPQAKIYTHACALGPGIVLDPIIVAWPDVSIGITISRAEQQIFAAETSTARLRRSPDELVAYLGRSLSFPDGVVLLTGTGIVPPDDFTLQAGDRVEIAIGDLQPLINKVAVV